MAFLAVNGGTFDLGLDPANQYGVFDDTILILGSGNTVHTREGNDTVYANRLLSSNLNAQTIFLGLGNDVFFGGANFITSVSDGEGNDAIYFGSGGGFARVGAGNDFFRGGSGVETATFQQIYADDGTATPNTSGVVFDLAKSTAQNLGVFGIDTFLNFDNAIGGGGNDKLFGAANGNFLDGLGGIDILDGRAGNDVLAGGEGADWIIGGAGRDVMGGGERLAGFTVFSNEATAAQDRFRFLAITDSSANPAVADSISLFDKGGTAFDDRIDLSAIDANPLIGGNQAFVFRGGGAFTAVRGEVRLVVSGADTLVSVDTDTDAAPEMVIRVVGVTGLTAADFIL